ncbi:MAG: CAP domain-containing protein [Candidatus Nitrosocaldus sp.]
MVDNNYNKCTIILPDIPLNIVIAKLEYDGSSISTVTVSGGTYDYKDEGHDKLYIYLQDTSGENFLGDTVKPVIKRLIDSFNALDADYIKHISPSEILACFIDNPRMGEIMLARNVVINSVRDIVNINSIIVSDEVDVHIENILSNYISKLMEDYMKKTKVHRKNHGLLNKGIIITAVILPIVITVIAIYMIDPTPMNDLLNLQQDNGGMSADHQQQQQQQQHSDEAVRNEPTYTEPSAPPTETPPTIDVPVISSIPLPTKSYTYGELVQYALSLINEDRAKYNLSPVTLGNNMAAQIHAEDMLRHRYLSHWDSDGFKPYMRYVQYNGDGEVSENAAMMGYYNPDGSTDCYKPFIYCDKIDPKDAIARLHHDMVYNDADSNWGHRDNILDKWHNKVNIGIAYDDYFLAFVQHFENDYIEWDARYIFNDYLVMSGRIYIEPNTKVKPVALAVYYDPIPRKMSTLELNNSPNCYSYGGGIICSSDAIDMIYPPPPSGYYYADKVHVAERWIVDGNYFYIESSITPSVGEGVYTVVLFTDIGEEQVPLASHTIVYRDGRWVEISTLR